MNKCIYLKGIEPELTFNSAEHIIPAGIGGIKKLPYGMVSDKVNNEVFSSIELEFIRNSPISLPRQFHGPGKRGSASDKKASKSNVHVMTNLDNNSKFNLGYIKLGKPILIRQFVYSIFGNVQFNFDNNGESIEVQLDQFLQELNDFKGFYKEIISDQIPIDYFILGVEQNKWYLAKNKNSQVPDLSKVIAGIINAVKNAKIDPQFEAAQVTCHQTMSFNMDNYFRVCGKIVFNFLALCKGHDFVLESKFDPIRNWIVSSGENNYVQIIDRKENLNILKELLLPPLSHNIIISKVDRNLVGILSFYGSNFEVKVKLCDNYDSNYLDIDGFICDWKNKKEYRLIDYLNKNANFT